MNFEEQNYLDLLRSIKQTFNNKNDRTGIGTKSKFGTRLEFSLSGNKMPILTTKKIYFKGVVEELLFFIRGNTDTKELENKGVNIWKGNTSKEFLKLRGLPYKEGEMGPMYGYQWRHFNDKVDQLKNVFNLIKEDPDSRRMVVSAYNPSVSHLTVLDPCHMFFQFYVENKTLSCQFYMRSVDTFLGLPFNIASYALLTHLMAKATGLTAGKLVFVGGDTHIYSNHMEQVNEQIERVPFEFPVLSINKYIGSIQDIERLNYSDFELIDYNHHPGIKAEMAV